jgi:hypothetical protein
MALTNRWYVDITPVGKTDAATRAANKRPNDVPHFTSNPMHTLQPSAGMGTWFDSFPEKITAFQCELFRRNVVDELNFTDRELWSLWVARYPFRRMSTGTTFPESYVNGCRNTYNTGRHGCQHGVVPPTHELSPQFVRDGERYTGTGKQRYTSNMGTGDAKRVPTKHVPDEHVPVPGVKQSKRTRKISA